MKCPTCKFDGFAKKSKGGGEITFKIIFFLSALGAAHNLVSNQLPNAFGLIIIMLITNKIIQKK